MSNQGNNLGGTLYDNDVTLSYKYAGIYKVPIRLIVVTPDKINNKHLYEPLFIILQRLVRSGDSPVDFYDTITTLNPSIRVEDIASVYYDLLRKGLIENTIDNNPPDEIYKTINKLYQLLDENNIVDKFENNNNIERVYNAWITDVVREWEKDMKHLEVINDIQVQLADIDTRPKIPISPLSINSSFVLFTPTIDDRKVVANDGLDIFNDAILSKYVPFIRYNNQYNESIYKLYTGEKIENEPNYSNIIIPNSEASDKNTIYIKLWLGDPDNNGSVQLSEGIRESFFSIVYDLETNFITIESPIGENVNKNLVNNEAIAHQRIFDAFPSLSFGNMGKETKISGDFNIWGLEIDETVFLDMILLEPLFNVYLYIEEKFKPFALKKRLDIHYRSIFTDISEGKMITTNPNISNSASVSVTLTQKQMTENENIDIFDVVTDTVTKAKMEKGKFYIHANVTQSISRAAIIDFIPIFQLLLSYYMYNKDQIGNVYYSLLPELNQLNRLLNQRKEKILQGDKTILEIAKVKSGNRRSGEKITKLKEEAPDLFVAGYSRKCQLRSQPIIVSDEEAQSWRQKRIGTALQNQIMTFPKEGTNWNFVCPTDEEPYPGLQVNKYLSNKDIYPYIPCCFKSNQMNTGMKSAYMDYIQNKPLAKKIGAKADKKINTRKVLSPDKIAFLPKEVEEIVKKYSPDSSDMIRYGIIYSPNSLLHCVCIAIDDPNYLSLQTENEKEDYIIRIRRYMASKLHISLLKQEMYDYTDDEIRELFNDSSRFLDPALFYRAVEETFNVNIYVFSPPPISDEKDPGTIEVPRFNTFHSHIPRLYRQTIVIFKTFGSESDSLEYPQCELIIDYDEKNMRNVKLFGPEMTELCYQTLKSTLETIVWNLLPNNEFNINSDIYYYIDHLELFNVPIISQYVDTNGKMRALNIRVNNRTMTVVTIPSQPENLPIDNNVNRISIDIAISIFGQPSGITKDNNGNVDGLWFQIMDVIFGEYIPVIPENKYGELVIGPPNPIIEKKVPIVSRLTKLKRTVNVIVQLIKWLYELTRLKSDITPITFIQQYCVMDNRAVTDSTNYYDLTRIRRKLPDVETIEQGIRSLEPIAPTLFNGGKIVLYSSLFSNRIFAMLRHYDNLTFGTDINIPEYIDKYFETEHDFKQVLNNRIFMKDKDLTAWLISKKELQNYNRHFNIRDKIDTKINNLEPYLYQDEDGKIYMIQNVFTGDFQKAITTAYTWFQYKVNIGSDPIPENITPVHMVYGISSSGNLTPIIDNTNGSETFVRILLYESNTDKLDSDKKYAAIFEIL